MAFFHVRTASVQPCLCSAVVHLISAQWSLACPSAFILVVVMAEAFTARLQAAGVPEALAKAFVAQGYESEEDVSSSFISEVVFLRTVKSHLFACCTFLRTRLRSLLVVFFQGLMASTKKLGP